VQKQNKRLDDSDEGEVKFKLFNKIKPAKKEDSS
jgi:hypothetical protein